MFGDSKGKKNISFAFVLDTSIIRTNAQIDIEKYGTALTTLQPLTKKRKKKIVDLLFSSSVNLTQRNPAKQKKAINTRKNKQTAKQQLNG